MGDPEATKLFIRTEEPDGLPFGMPATLIDTPVYTRNRCFRLQGSHTFAKTAPLLVAVDAVEREAAPRGFGEL